MYKKTVLITAIAALTLNGFSAFAQAHQPKLLHHVKPINDEDNDSVERFKDQLNLTEDQKNQIKAIREKRAAEKADLKNKLKELRLAERTEIDAVLTEEQRALLKEKKEAKEFKHHELKGKRPIQKPE